MNTLNGYAKSTLTNDYLLTAAGGHKSVLDFLSSSGGTINGALTVTGAATFAQAINGNILGNSATTSRLLNARTITIGNKSNTFDGSGDISFTLALIGAQASGNYKTKQTAVSTIGASTNTLTFINSISQDTNGVISATTGVVRDASTSVAGIVNTTTQSFVGTKTFTGDNWATQVIIKRNNGNDSVIRYDNSTGLLGYIGVGSGKFPYWATDSSHIYTLYHTGNLSALTTSNYTSYAVSLTGAQTISGNKTFSSSVSIDDLTAGNFVVTGGVSFALELNCGNINAANLTLTGIINLANNKTIGFKDTGGDNRTCITFNSYNLLAIGYGSTGAGYDTYLDGKNIYFRTGTSHTTALTINNSQQATFAGMINTIAAQATEGSTLAATTAGIDMKNSNLKGLNGIYFADESNVVNEGIHFVRGDQTNKVDTLLSYRGNLYYRTNRALGTTKDDGATTSANIIVHSGNVGSYHQKHTVSRFTSANGITDGSNIYYSGTSMNGYWLGDLEYTGQTLTYNYPTNNSTKYTFTTTNKSDIVIIDTEDWVQIFLSINKPAGTVIDIYTCANTQLNFKVMANYNGNTRNVIISDGDTYTVCTDSNYSNIYYYWYNTSVTNGRPPGTEDYPQARCLWFDITNRGVVRIVYTGTDIYIFKLCAFPA